MARRSHSPGIPFQSCPQICLWHSTGGSFPDAGFCKVLVKAVQMHGADIMYRHVPDCLICPIKQPPIARHGAVLCAGALFQVDYIGGVFCEGLSSA